MTSDMTIGAVPAAEQTTPTDPLLASKLTVPEAPPFMVDRGRLLDQLSRAVRNPITVVTGPPGCGKTQLAASWVASGAAPGPVIWISLEDGDNDSAVFWPYLIEGLRRSGIVLSPPIEEAAHSAGFDRPMLARLAADLAAAQQPVVVLVLDSASVLADRQLAEELDALLRHADHHLRIVLVGRWDPPLPLYRYRLNGKLSEIRGEDLAFTTDETATLLAGHAVELPDWAIGALVERTEGWAVGLRLFALAMKGRADAEELVVTIAGDDANIAEYFLGEVLAAQPPEIRDFLLRTSIVDDFTAELAEALIQQGDARHIITVLERANAFVQPVAARSTVHRYHRLFAELLRAQLAYEKPEQVTQLHRRATAWYAAHDQSTDAIRHAVAAGDWEYACAILVEDLSVGRLLGEDADRLRRLFLAMPADADGPQAAMVLAAKALTAGEDGEAVRQLNRVDPASSESSVPMRLTVALLDAVAALKRHDDARALCAAGTAGALLALASPAAVAAHPELRTVLLVTKGTAQNRSGALADAVVTLTEAAGGVQPAGCEGIRLAGLEQLALAYAYQGRLQEAADAAARAIHLVGQHRRMPPRPSSAASAVLAWVASERWIVADAWRHLRAAEAGVPAADDPLTTTAIALVRSRLLSGRGELRGAARALGTVRSDTGVAQPEWLVREVTFDVARLHVAMGQPDEALATSRELASAAPAEAAVVSAAALVARGDARQAREVIRPVVETAGLPSPLLIEAWLLVAVVAGESGEASTVRDALGQALALGAADGHRRAFHQAGPWLRHLLRNDTELAAGYQALGASSPARARNPTVGAPAADKPIVVDSLSERELQVLRHLAAMMGTEEIADAMYLSVNTVKTHVRSILRKLAASRRNEAVRRARALGIV
ncbi:LuxR C-terminal-related transcriptional regulator [Actinoplanes sp. CA-051413]|uniref:LuxR C-terminal-related transcriptional regulator n=1 Tax=Actinoplanes sp. CA-051413 TaxID=3239899 RepID=UPI003D989BB3